MFSAVTIANDSFDIGNISEALIYYGRVNLVVNSGSLFNFSQRFGSDNLLRLIDMGRLRLMYDRNQYGVATESNPFRTHSFQSFSLVRLANDRPINTAADEIAYKFVSELGKSKKTTEVVRELADRVNVREISNEIPQQALRDSLDQEFISNAVRAWLQIMVPEYELTGSTKIETMDTGKGLILVSNLDFDEINKFYHRRIPATHSSVSDSYLLANVLGMRKEIVFGADSDSEIWIGLGESAMLRTRINMLARRITRSHSQIETFHEVQFEGRTFREVINSGERTPIDLIKLLETEEAIKFKAWLSSQDPSSNLIKEYDRAVLGKSGWTERLPFKVGKIFTFAGIGAAVDAFLGTMGMATLATSAISAASDVAFGASDEFVISKLAKGWKPSHFIEGPATRFLEVGKKESELERQA